MKNGVEVSKKNGGWLVAGVYLKGQLSAITSSASKLNYLLHVSDCLFDFRICELRLGRREHQIMHALILKNKSQQLLNKLREQRTVFTL